MNLLSITAGAADMFCGSCLRDNALAAEMIRRGHQVTLLPVYTPTVTDEPNMSAGRPVLYGGISVYLQQHFSFFRHTPWLLDRLWDAPAVIRAFATGSIQVDPKMLGALTVSTLRGESGYQKKEVAKLLHWLAAEPRPDLVNLPNSMLIALAAPIKRALGRPIVVTLQGDDLFLEGLQEPYKSQSLDLIREQVRHVDMFVAVSDYYTRFMTDYLRIPHDRIRSVPLGVNVRDLTLSPRLHGDGATGGEPFTIGYFARVAPEKGLDRLAEAYRILRHERGLPPSRLVAAGYRGADQRAYFESVLRQLTAAGLDGEFDYAGTVDRDGKVRFLHSIDVLSVPSPYHEPKGLYLLEAMACGVPVVAPNHGAFPEMLQRTGGGILAASPEPTDIADAILAMHTDRNHARQLGRRGGDGVRAFYTIEQMTDRMIDLYADVAGMPRQTRDAVTA